ncbi:MAG TPA: MGMT family protein [Acidimicrobiia bacterium]|nr:MGMT family protein [Acidimicrobiia bacterium]
MEPAPHPNEFDRAVEDVLLGLSPGEVVTYGWVAAEAGYPGRHRSVGTFLANRFQGPNWWLVVGSDRRLHAPDTIEQERRLRADGVAVEGGKVLGEVQRP